MPDPYQPFASSQFDRSTTPPTAFASAGYAPSTTPPSAFGAGILADLAALRAVPTPALPLNPAAVRQVASATAGETVRAYQLEAGTAADNDDTVIRPTDYAAETNERLWRRVL
jgi:hypothetical protein